jgi:adenine/guanine phosphoribosyltransferase-like PRPP-binding protein
VVAAREALLSKFTWRDGHADVWRVFADGPGLAAVVAGLAAPWQDAGITKVIGIESRGFLLGGAVALRLGVGFQAVRKVGGLLPGNKLTVDCAPDYRGTSHQLRMQDVLDANDVVLLVDDWAERGSQAVGVRQLIERSGSSFAGVSLMVDQLDDQTRAELGRVVALVTADELGDPDA